MYKRQTKGCKKKKFKKFSNLRNLKNKKYPFWRLDTLFSDIRQIDISVISDGGWHFTNLKSPEDLFLKLKNFGHHDEFDESGISSLSLINIRSSSTASVIPFSIKLTMERFSMITLQIKQLKINGKVNIN